MAEMQVIFTFYIRGGNKINSRLAKARSNRSAITPEKAFDVTEF